MVASKNDIKVCVTGASGFVASHIVADLLQQGYTVHGTVRTLGGESSKHLTVETLCPTGAPGKLKLFSADLLTDGAFDEAVQGCTYVLHTASPFIYGKVKNAQKQLIQPALKGTENVLNSASKFDSVKRVVLTSSILAVYNDNYDKKGEMYNEEDWNTQASESYFPYNYSKTLAEQRAWEIEKDASWDMVVINPSLVIGPTLSGRGNDGTFTVMKQILFDFKFAPKLTFGLVDVRDVAKSHRLAFEKENCSGRHIAVENTYPIMEIGAMIREKYPKYPTPKTTIPKSLFMLVGPLLGYSRRYIRQNVNHPLKMDNGKIKSLLDGEMTPMKQTLYDTIESMIEHGMIKRK